MSDSDKALLAAAAMRAKKNAIDQGKGLSVTAKVRALGQAGFTDSEIDRIMRSRLRVQCRPPMTRPSTISRLMRL